MKLSGLFSGAKFKNWILQTSPVDRLLPTSGVVDGWWLLEKYDIPSGFVLNLPSDLYDLYDFYFYSLVIICVGGISPEECSAFLFCVTAHIG